MKQLLIIVFCLLLVGCDQLPTSKKYELTVIKDRLIVCDSKKSNKISLNQVTLFPKH